MIYLHKIQLESPENKSQKNLERKSHAHNCQNGQNYAFVIIFEYKQFFQSPKRVVVKKKGLRERGFCYKNTNRLLGQQK